MKTKKALLLTFAVLAVSILLSIIISSGGSEGYNKKRNLTLVFYNVENLFDTENTPGGNDAEFTPEGKNNWTADRYLKKLDDISRVLGSVNKYELPEIIGLCEVENRKVLEDLITNQMLSAGKYEIVHFESPDFRGIDCALLYRPDEFEVMNSRPLRVAFTDDVQFTTRDILYVKGETNNRELFHIFVNHWPSRIGGVDQTESKRVAVAAFLKSKIDSVKNADPKSNVVVMGDMNDEPSNKSLYDVLLAKEPDSNADLVNLMFPLHHKREGSYNYRGNWNMLDNIVVSGNLLDNRGFRCREKQGFVFREKWMEYENNGSVSPNRTYGGPNYYGGVSDHFPVYFQLSR